MRRRGNLNRPIHGLTNTKVGIPGCPVAADFNPGTPPAGEALLRRLLGCDGSVPQACVALLVSILSWRHTAHSIDFRDRTWRPDLLAVTLSTTEGDLDLRADKNGGYELRPAYGELPDSADLTLRVFDGVLRLSQGAVVRDVPCAIGAYAAPDLSSLPGASFTLVRKDGAPVRDGDTAVLRNAPFAYPFTQVRAAVAASSEAMQLLLEAGVGGYFVEADSDREAVALAASALINATLTRTGY